MKIKTAGSVFLAFAAALFFQILNSSSSAQEQQKKEREFSSSEIMSKIDEIYEKLKNEDIKENPLQLTQITIFRLELEEISKYPELEKKTRIYREWFVKLTKILKAMEPCRDGIIIAIANKDRELYIKSRQDHDKYFKAFEETYKDPPKIRRGR